MIDKIRKGIKTLVENRISPNTIRMHPVDVYKLKRDHWDELYELSFKISTIFGLRIIETTRVEEGTADIYNDNDLYIIGDKLIWIWFVYGVLIMMIGL